MADITTLPSGKPVIRYGVPGRSAVSGNVATVFGCTGFLGRYLVAKLGEHPQSLVEPFGTLCTHFSHSLPSRRLRWNPARAGTQVIIPYREEDTKRHLKVTGDLGQIVNMVRHSGFQPSFLPIGNLSLSFRGLGCESLFGALRRSFFIGMGPSQ